METVADIQQLLNDEVFLEKIERIMGFIKLFNDRSKDKNWTAGKEYRLDFTGFAQIAWDAQDRDINFQCPEFEIMEVFIRMNHLGFFSGNCVDVVPEKSSVVYQINGHFSPEFVSFSGYYASIQEL